MSGVLAAMCYFACWLQSDVLAGAGPDSGGGVPGLAAEAGEGAAFG